MVGDGGGDLHAAVHRAWVHDERVRLGAGELLVVEAEEVEVLAGRGHVGALHALALQAQHHDDVGTLQPGVHVGEDLDAAGARRRGGSRVEGATTRTRAPMVFSTLMLERATRECMTSPQIATVSPPMRPLARRMVRASSSACVGC